MTQNKFFLIKSLYLEISIVLGTWLVVAWPFLKLNRFVYGFDTVAYTGPATKFVFESWHKFQIPLWNDEMFGGVPFLGRLGSQALYFPNWPFSFLSLNTALDLSMAAHLLLLGCGFLVYVRSGLRLIAPAGSFAAVIVLASAFVGVKTMSFDQLVAIAWLPWILYFIELVLDRRFILQSIAGLSISASLLVLGGHPQFIYLFFLFFLSYILARMIDKRSWHSILYLIISGILTIGVVMLQAYSTYSLNSSSVMAAKKSIDSLASPAYVLPVQRTIAGIIGNPFSDMPIGVTGAGEAIAGIGFAAVLLAITGCLSLWRRKSYFLLGTLLFTTSISLVLSHGSSSKIFVAFYKFFPGFGNARVPGRLLSISLVSIVILASYGIHYLSNAEQFVLSRVERFLVGILVLLFALLSLTTSQDFLNGNAQLFFILGVFIFLGLLVIGRRVHGRKLTVLFLLVFCLFPAVVSQRHSPARNSLHIQPFDTIKNGVTDFLSNQEGQTIALTHDRLGDAEYLIKTLRPNTNILNGVQLIDGYDGGMWVQKRWVQSMKSLTGGEFNNDLTARSQIVGPLNPSILARLGVRWAVVDTDVTPAEKQLDKWHGPVLIDGTVQLWENPNWKDEATIYFKSTTTISKSELIKVLTDPNFSSVAIIEDEEFELDCLNDCLTASSISVQNHGLRGEIKTKTTSPSLLAIHKSWSRDWQVHVDSKPVVSFPINENQLGIQLPIGSHTINFEYNPAWSRPLFALMVFSLLILICLLIFSIQIVKTSFSKLISKI